MSAVKAGDVDALIRRGPSPDIAVLLVFGPDTGLVADRVAALVKSFVSDPDDPFALVRLEGDLLASDQGRLVDEAGTIGLFGGSRTIRIRVGNRSIAPAVEALLSSGLKGTHVVLEAGDLARSAPLRTLCEKAPTALALPCYADDAQALGRLIERQLAEDGLSIDPSARDVMAASLGADRRGSLAEIEKLALYARGRSRVGLDEVEAVVGDVSAITLTTLVDAVFAGRARIVEAEFRRFWNEGLDPSVVLGTSLRHAFALLTIRLDKPGEAPSALVSAWRGLHFRRQRIVEAQFSAWSTEALRRVIASLQDAVLACRRAGPALAQAHASAVLLHIATDVSSRQTS